MDVQVLFAPVFATCVLGLLIAAVAWARPEARSRWLGWPWVWGGLLAMGLAFLASRAGVGPAEWVNVDAALRAFGIIALVLAGVVAILAGRFRRRGDFVLASAPVELDEAIQEVRATAAPVKGLFRGRLGSEEEVTSPGGVVCAFYEAQLRQRSGSGRKGMLLSTERASTSLLWLRGNQAQALVAFALDSTWGPVEVRRCTIAGSLALGTGRALAGGEPPTEAQSFEKVGRKGERCLVLGELRPGPVRGSYVIRGLSGGVATVLLGEDGGPLARAMIRRAWRLYAVSLGLCALAAWLLGR